MNQKNHSSCPVSTDKLKTDSSRPCPEVFGPGVSGTKTGCPSAPSPGFHGAVPAMSLVHMYTGRPSAQNRPPLTMEHFIAHLKTVTRHKLLVLEGCWKVGLYRQGLIHDLSKFSPTEFMVGARYFQGDRSPNNAERENIGYSSSWLHHKGRNRHHFEYWMDYNLRGKEGESPIIPIKMPGRYVVEMLMDRIAACKIYMGERYTDSSPLAYFRGGKASHFMHPETSALLEKLLVMLEEKGEEKTFAYIKSRLSK